MTNPVLTGVMMSPGEDWSGEDWFYKIDLAGVARALPWQRDPNFSTTTYTVTGYYYGYESFGSTLTDTDLSDFNLTNL